MAREEEVEQAILDLLKDRNDLSADQIPYILHQKPSLEFAHKEIDAALSRLVSAGQLTAYRQENSRYPGLIYKIRGE